MTQQELVKELAERVDTTQAVMMAVLEEMGRCSTWPPPRGRTVKFRAGKVWLDDLNQPQPAAPKAGEKGTRSHDMARRIINRKD